MTVPVTHVIFSCGNQNDRKKKSNVETSESDSESASDKDYERSKPFRISTSYKGAAKYKSKFTKEFPFVRLVQEDPFSCICLACRRIFSCEQADETRHAESICQVKSADGTFSFLRLANVAKHVCNVAEDRILASLLKIKLRSDLIFP